MLPNVGQADNLGWLHHFHYLLLDNWLGDNALASAAFTVCQTERRRGRRRSPHFHLNVKLEKNKLPDDVDVTDLTDFGRVLLHRHWQAGHRAGRGSKLFHLGFLSVIVGVAGEARVFLHCR